MPLTYGPETPEDDERVIAAGYRHWLIGPLVASPLATAWIADIKWVVAVGFVASLYLLNNADARLHDLCIRLRRSNLLLRKKPVEGISHRTRG